jgi:hypothetical protein
MSTIYLFLYFLMGVGEPTLPADMGNVAQASSVSGDTFKSPF